MRAVRDKLTEALDASRRAGVIDKYPPAVAVAGHFLRADLCACSDWAFGATAGSKEEVEKRRRREVKRQVDAVRGTFATTTLSTTRFIGQANGGKGTKVSIVFVDTALLAPAGMAPWVVYWWYLHPACLASSIGTAVSSACACLILILLFADPRRPASPTQYDKSSMTSSSRTLASNCRGHS